MQTGPITQVSISYNEDWIAFSCTNGLVYVVRRRSNILSLSPDTQISYEHEGNAVTALKWDLQNAQLFVGDDSGRVSVFNLYYIIVSFNWCFYMFIYIIKLYTLFSSSI